MSMFSRRHYKFLAEHFKQRLDMEPNALRQASIKREAISMSYALQQENMHFKRHLFIAACGISDD